MKSATPALSRQLGRSGSRHEQTPCKGETGGARTRLSSIGTYQKIQKHLTTIPHQLRFSTAHEMYNNRSMLRERRQARVEAAGVESKGSWRKGM